MVAAFLEMVDAAPVEAMASVVVAAVGVAVGAKGEMRGIVVIAAAGVAASIGRVPSTVVALASGESSTTSIKRDSAWEAATISQEPGARSSSNSVSSRAAPAEIQGQA